MAIALRELNPFQEPPYPVWRFSVADYHRLIAAGGFTEDDPVELLEGWIVPKMPHNPLHDSILDGAQETIGQALPSGWRIRVQMAITTADSEPEPDIAVVRGPADRYRKRHPGPQDIAMLVEVSDATLRSDRVHKGRLYARAAIPFYWIINLVDGQVEVYTEPTGSTEAARYRCRQDYKKKQSVPLIVGGKTIAEIPVRDLLG